MLGYTPPISQSINSLYPFYSEPHSSLGAFAGTQDYKQAGVSPLGRSGVVPSHHMPHRQKFPSHAPLLPREQLWVSGPSSFPESSRVLSASLACMGSTAHAVCVSFSQWQLLLQGRDTDFEFCKYLWVEPCLVQDLLWNNRECWWTRCQPQEETLKS